MSEFAGTLRETVVLQRRDDTRSAEGLLTGQWVSFATCWAAVVPDGNGAEAEGMSLSQMPRYRVTIRQRPGVAVDQQLRWRARALLVRQVLDDPRSPDRLVLRCEEVRS